MVPPFSVFFFFNDTATTEIYTLSLHDALPISGGHRKLTARDLRARSGRQRALVESCVGNAVWLARQRGPAWPAPDAAAGFHESTLPARSRDPQSTRLNSSQSQISYAGFRMLLPTSRV